MNKQDMETRQKYNYYILSALYRKAISLGDFQLAKEIGDKLKIIEKH